MLRMQFGWQIVTMEEKGCPQDGALILEALASKRREIAADFVRAMQQADYNALLAQQQSMRNAWADHAQMATWPYSSAAGLSDLPWTAGSYLGRFIYPNC